MKLRLPHKFQAALLAAIASVSFTTLSTGTLGAAFFVSGHAFAEDAEEEPSATIDIGDTNLDAQAAMEEEEGTAEKEPGSAPINEAGSNGGPGNNAGLLITESDDIDETALDTVVSSEPVAVTSGSADSTPSDDLGFTSNPYATGSDTSNGSDDFSLTGTAPAAAYVPGQTGISAEEGDSAAGTGSGSSTNKTTTGDIGSIGGIGSTGSGAIGGSAARPMALTASNLGSPVSSLSVGGSSLGGDSGSASPAMLGAVTSTVSSPTAENAAGWFVHDTTTSTWTLSNNCSVSGNSYSFTEGGSEIHFNNNTGATNRGVYTFAFTVDLDKLASVTGNTILLRAGEGTSYLSGVGMTQDRKLTLTWQNNAQYNGWSFAQLGSEGLVTIVLTEGNSGGYLSAYKNDANWTVLQSREGSNGLRGTGNVTQFTLGSELANAITAFAVWQTSDTWDASNMLSAAKALSDLPLSEGLVWNGTSDSHTWTNNSSTPWTGGTFTEGADVTFSSLAANKEVLVQSAITAGTMTVSDDYTFKTNSNGSLTASSLSLKDGADVVLYAEGQNRVFNLGDVDVEGTASIMNRWFNATQNINSIAGGATDTLTLISNDCGDAATWNIGQSEATNRFSGKLVLQAQDSDGNAKSRTVNFNIKNRDMLSGATIETKNGPIKSVGTGLSMTNNINLGASEVKFGGINDGGSDSTARRNNVWTIKPTSGTSTLTLDGTGIYSTSVAVGANVNINKTGAGTQIFTGNMGSFSGNIDVSGGTLILSSAITSANSVNVSNGGILNLGASLTTTGAVTVGSGSTLKLASGNLLTSGGDLTLTGSTLDLRGMTFTTGQAVTLATSNTGTINYSGVDVTLSPRYSSDSYTLTQSGNNLTFTYTGPEPTENTLHIYLLTGQSNSLGAVKKDPASAAMLAEYASGIQMWDGNMSGSVTDPGVDTANKAWDDTNKHWFTVQQQQTPTGEGVYGPAGTPYANIKGKSNLVSTWGGNVVMGPEYGFSSMMERQGWDIESGKSDIAIVKVSRDGGANTYWDPESSGNICPQILDSVVKALLDVDTTQYTNISLDGLLFLQGETGNQTQGSNVKNVLNRLINYLQNGLAQEKASGRLQGISDSITVSIGDSIVLGEPAGTGACSVASATVYKNWAATDPETASFVYTHDMNIISSGDQLNLHFDGNSQITIGARYAYALAQVEGLDTTRDGEVRVRSQYYGDTALGESASVSLNDSSAWWQSTGDKVAYTSASMANTVAVWDVSSADMANLSRQETLTGDLSVKGIRIEDPHSNDESPGDHKATITINNASGTHTLSVGSSGIVLQQGNLTIGANLEATDNQTWNTNATPASGSAQQNTLNLTGTTTIASGATVTVEGASIVNISTLAGTGGLTVNGEGAVVTLTDKTAFTGATTVTSGTLKIAGTDDLTITGDLVINGNNASFAGNITADTVTLSNIATSGSQGTFDKYAGVITGTHTITLDHYTVANMDASLVTQTLVATNSTSTTIHNLTLTACEVSVESGSNVTLADSLILGDSATYTGTLNLADGLTIDVSNMTLGGAGSSVALLSTENGNLGNTDISKLSVDFGSGSPAPEYTLSMSGNNLILTLASATKDLIWNTGNGTWDVNNTAHWHTAEAPAASIVFNQGDNVTFESGTATATLDGNITAGDMTLNSGAVITVATGSNNLTVEGTVSGTGQLTKTGNGKLTFSSEEDATLGKLTINGGTAEFDGHVIISGGSRMDVQSGKAEFMDGLDNTSGNDHALTVNNGSGYEAILHGTSNFGTKAIGIGAAGKLTIAENAIVTSGKVQNSGTFANNGAIEVGTGATFNVQGLFDSTSVTNKGTINVSGGATHFGSFANDGTLNITYSARNATIATFGGVSGGGVSGEGDINITGGSGGRTYNFTGDISGWTGTLTQTATSGSMNLNISGTAELNANILNEATTNADCCINVNLKSNMTVGGSISYTDKGPVHVNVGDAGTVVSASFTNDVKAGTFSVANADSSATLNGLTTVATISGNGDIVVGSTGTLALTNTAAITFGGDLDVDGTLKLAGSNLLTTGTLDFGNDAILDLTNITVSGTAPITLMSTTGGITGTLSEVELTHLTAPDGYKGVLTQDNNALLLTFTPLENALIWDNNQGTGKWNTTDSNWHVGTATAGSSLFKTNDDVKFTAATPNATVTMDGAITAGSMTVAEGATVTIATSTDNTLNAAEGITVENGATMILQGTGVTGALSGSGVVVGNAIPSQASWTKSDVLGSGVTFGDDWTGTVEVSGGNTTYNSPYVVLNTINDLGTANSTVRLKGVGGYFTEVTIIPNIELVNAADGSPAVLITAGNGKTTTFSGNIKGDGDLLFDKAGGSHETYKFTGDLYGWTGTLKTGGQNTGGLTLELAGANQVVNAEILQGSNNRALNVKVDNAATFNNSVTATKLEVANNATATLNGLTTVAAISGNGDIEVGSTGTLALTNTTAITFGGDLGVDGTLKLAGSNLLTTGTLDFGNDAILDLTNITVGGTDPITLVSTTGGITGTLSEVELTHLDAPEGYRGVLTQDNNNLVLTFEMIAHDLIWNTGSGNWDVDNTKQWHMAEDLSTNVVFNQNDNVKFETGTSTATLTTEDITAGTMTLDSGANLTLATGTHDLTTKDFVATGGASLVKDGTGAVQFGNAAGDADTLQSLTVNDGDISFEGKVTVTGDLTVDNANTSDSTVEFNGGLTVNSAVNAMHGNIVVGGTGESSIKNLDISRGGGASNATLTVKDGASLGIGTNMWMGTNAKIELEDGSVKLLNTIQASSLESGESTVTRTGGESHYSTEHNQFVITNAAVTSLADATIGNKLVDSTLTSAHDVTLNNAANELTSTTVTANTLTVSADMDLGAVTVYNGATLALTSSSPVTIGSGTIAGTLSLANPSQFSVNDGVFTFASGSTLDLSSLSITEGTPVTLATATGSGSFSPIGLRGVELDFGGQTYENARLAVEGNSLVLTFVEPGRDLVWQGGPGTWDTASDNKVWFESAESQNKVAFESHDNVEFKVAIDSPVTIDEPQITAGNVMIDAGVNVTLESDGSHLDANEITVDGNLTVRNVAISADSMVINEGGHATANVEGSRTGALATNVSGAGDVTKMGTGNLALTGDNSGFTGTLTIENGAVVAGSAKALGDTPNVVLAGGNLAGANGVTVAPTDDINITSTQSGTVSANLEVAEGATLTFNTTGETTITDTGVISGSGSIVKDGTGTLVLGADNTYTGGLDINHGTVLVSNVGALGGEGSQRVNVSDGGSLKFDSAVSGTYTADYIALDRGSVLTFAGTDKLDIGTLYLTAASAVDLSNITVDHYGSYVLADVDHLYGAEPGIFVTDSNPDGIVQFISMVNFKPTATETWSLQDNDLISLHYKNGQLTLDVRQANTPAYYWKPSDDPAAVGSWNTNDSVWYSNAEFDGNTKKFTNTQGTASALAGSVYFLDAGDDHEEHISLDIPEYIYVRDVVVAGGRYIDPETGEEKRSKFYFTGPYTDDSYIKMDVNRLSNFVVRGGTEAHLVNALVNDGAFDVIHVCKDGLMTIDDTDTWGVYSINNEGEFYVDSDLGGIENIMGHVDNYKDMVIHFNDTADVNSMTVGQVENRQGASLIISAPSLYGDFFGAYGDGILHNEGELVFDVTGYDVTGLMETYLPIHGAGTFATTGPEATVFLGSEVLQGSVELGAMLTELAGEVVTDATTVDAGATALFEGGGSLGAVTLAAAEEGDAATIQFAGYYGDAMEYVADSVTAGTDSVFDVQGDATVTIGGYNADLMSDVPTGTIVVGDVEGEVDPAHLVVNGVTKADTLDVQSGAADLNGNAIVSTLTQSGGTANFNAGGFVDNGTVSGGTLAIGDDQVLTLGHTITETGDYTVAETTGTINADALELHKDMTNAGYVEVHHTTEEKTKDQSGFLSGGEQYVVVFDIQDGALTANDVIVTHKDAAGPMRLISSSDPKHSEYAGRGYLDTSETVYTTYYVRDNYVTGKAGSRRDSEGEPVADREADYVTLSQVISTAEDNDTVLAAVVFDETDYNKGETAVHGSITVDVQNQHADLFHVTEGTVGVVNITTLPGIPGEKDPERILLCCCEDYAGVDGTMKIAGTGIYQIENRGDLGTNVSLLYPDTAGIDHWIGTVRLIGAAEDVDTDPLSVGSGDEASEIEFYQWHGSFKDTEDPMQSNAKILLTGTGVVGDPAITLTEGDANLLWTNTVSGEGGRIDHSQAGDFTLTMTGDTSAWNGTFNQAAEGSTVSLGFLLDAEHVSSEHENATIQNADVLASAGQMDVTYGGDLKTVNGNATVYGTGVMNLAYTGTGMQVNSNISKYNGQGTMDVTVGDGSNEASATFNGDITADTLTVETNADATLHNTTEISDIVEVKDDASLSIQNAAGKGMATITTSEDATDNATITGGVTMKSADGKAIISGTAGEERPATRVDGADVAVLGAAASLQIENLVLAADTMVHGTDTAGNLVISQKVVQEMSSVNTERVDDGVVPAAAQKILTMTGTTDSTITFENDKVANLDFASMCQMAQISGSAGTLVFDFTEMPGYDSDWEQTFSGYGFVGVNFNIADLAIDASDLTVKALTKDADGQVVERIGYYYNGGDGAVVGSIIYFQVPEPTTSTLSLLALAALAARRRRK